MAKTIEVLGSLDGVQNTPVLPVALKVKAGAVSSIKRGYLVIKDGSNAGYVAAAADGADSTGVNVGIAVADSTETASADGVVQVISAPKLLLKIFAKTPGSLATALLMDKYVLDVTSGNFTLDQGTTTNGIFRLLSFDNTTDGTCTAILNCDL